MANLSEIVVGYTRLGHIPVYKYAAATAGSWARMGLCAFALALPSWKQSHAQRVRICGWSRSSPRCAASRLVVIELDKVSTSDEKDVEANQRFSERVEVDRTAAKETAYIVYASELGHEAAMSAIKGAELVLPDALVAVDGSELYQRQYRTPDPYWEKIVGRGWDPKPMRWIVTEYFGDCVAETGIEFDEKFEISVKCKDAEEDLSALAARIVAKMAENGFDVRVKSRGNDGLVIVPASGCVKEAVAFCQMMMNIPQQSTFVYGKPSFVRQCLESNESQGIVDLDEGGVDLGEDRVFASSHKGADALLDGVLHFAVF